MYISNSKMTETKSPPLPFAATKMATNLALFKKPIMLDPSQFKQFKDAHEWNICHLHTVDMSRAPDLRDFIIQYVSFTTLMLFTSFKQSRLTYILSFMTKWFLSIFKSLFAHRSLPLMIKSFRVI